MPIFKYRAVDAQGEPHEGSMNEPTAAAVVSILEERGFQVSRVDPLVERNGAARGPRLSGRDLELVNEQLLTITNAGLPLPDGLRGAARDLRRGPIRETLERIGASLDSGDTLENALSRLPRSFDPVYVSMIRAGEKSGDLAGVLRWLHAYTSRTNELRESVRSAMAYPLFVFCLTLGVAALYLLGVLPQVRNLLSEGVTAPQGSFVDWFTTDTSLIVEYSAFTALFAVLGVVSMIMAGSTLRRRFPRAAYATDWLAMRLPIFGPGFRLASFARFGHALGLLLRARTPALEALDLAGAAAGNTVLRAGVRKAAVDVAAGARFADAFAETKFFPYTFCWMVSMGESRGDAADALESLAETYDRDLARRERMIATLAAPILITIVGLFIAGVFVSFYMPMLRSSPF